MFSLFDVLGARSSRALTPGAVAASALLVTSACVVGPVDYTNTRFSCGDGVCPPGFECVDEICVPEGVPPDAPPASNGFERQLVVDHSAGAAALIDFPLMVRLDATRIEYEVCQPDGSDVRFFGAGGAPLAHEIERWDPAGVSIIWVSVPRVEPAAEGATLTMRYGDRASVAADPAAVWADYHAVYHLADGSDSSPSNLDGVVMGAESVEGAVGPALRFTGGGELVDLGMDRPFLQNQTAATVSAWVRLEPTWAAPGVVFGSSVDAMQMPTNTSRLQLLVLDDRSFEGDARSLEDGPIINVIGPTVEVDRWTYLSFTVDFPGDRIELFIDGASVAVGEVLGLGPTSADSVSTQTTIGRGEGEGVDLFLGDIDEVRLSHEVRTADEIAADLRATSDQMLTFGPPAAL